VRAVTFVALDGVEPSNNTQGYVMRRFLRRALRQGLHLGIESGLLAALVEVVADIYSDAYPELAQDADRVRNVLEREEDLFRRTSPGGCGNCPSWPAMASTAPPCSPSSTPTAFPLS
jgi:alanyl-tRNA synthetase